MFLLCAGSCLRGQTYDVLIRGGRVLDGTGTPWIAADVAIGAIHSMTGLPAVVFHVRDRGAIRPGACADVVVFDLAAVRDRATYEQPHQLSEGMRHVFVNGAAALTDGRPTDHRAGRVLKRGRL